MIPAAILVLCLQGLIMVNMIRINRFGQRMSEAMQFEFSYLQISKEYENNSETLADKAKLYTSTGDASYLDGYFSTIQVMRDLGVEMTDMLSTRQDSSAYEEVNAALREFEVRIQTERRAIRLCADVFGLDLNDYPQLKEMSLTAEDLALSSPEKWTFAMSLLADGEYQRSVALVHERIGRAIRSVSTETAQKASEESSSLKKARVLQWVMAIASMVILNVLIVLAFTMLLSPLEKSVEKVVQGEDLPTNRGASEFRRLAASYNDLLRHKKRTESYLRKQSQTDALTGLANRTAFQEFFSRLNWEHDNVSVALFSLDVNGLKEANDQHGHAHGDELLRKSADCILSAFGEGPGKRCFRFGGDEFAAIWVGAQQEQIAPALERFEQAQKAYGTSISVGYAYTEDLSQVTMEDLFEQADQYMYRDKARHHMASAAAQ